MPTLGISRYQMLKMADPEVFNGRKYSREFQFGAGRQPILVDGQGFSLDGNQYDFVGPIVSYRGHNYASTNPQRSHIGFCWIDNASGLLAPACFVHPDVGHYLVPEFQKPQVKRN